MATTTRRRAALLWTAQALVAALFLFAGGMKLVTPIPALAAMSGLSGEFMRFIGTCETLGALGLVLPGIFRVRRELTPLAAAGLVIIMIGATVVSIEHGPAISAIVPAIVGSLCAWIARERGRAYADRLPRVTISISRRANA